MLTLLANMIEPPDPEVLQQTIENQSMGQANTESVPAELLESIFGAIDGGVIFSFFFFFIVGFFIYSAIFAALGAAVDNEQDMQQLQIPFTLPVFISLGLVFPVTQNPDGLHSIFLTLFPLTSPILMPARMAATNVPTLEIVASAIFAILGFLVILWLAAKIYRIGMLSTGKKPSFKDLWKWIRTA
jgi:ABC-2 type transport system permease protein